MRLVAKTTPMRQWEVARELRARVKAALDAAGVQPAGPDTIVVSAPPAVTPAAAPQPEPAAVAAGVRADTAAEDPLAATDLPPDDGAPLKRTLVTPAPPAPSLSGADAASM
jgi:small conductance mechanosensitive channel